VRKLVKLHRESQKMQQLKPKKEPDALSKVSEMIARIPTDEKLRQKKVTIVEEKTTAKETEERERKKKSPVLPKEEHTTEVASKLKRVTSGTDVLKEEEDAENKSQRVTGYSMDNSPISTPKNLQTAEVTSTVRKQQQRVANSTHVAKEEEELSREKQRSLNGVTNSSQQQRVEKRSVEIQVDSIIQKDRIEVLDSMSLEEADYSDLYSPHQLSSISSIGSPSPKKPSINNYVQVSVEFV
jgi:hypothetical protein